MIAKLLELLGNIGASRHTAPALVLVVVGAAGLASGVIARLRSKMGIVMPLVLSGACLAVGVTLMLRLDASAGEAGRLLLFPPPAGIFAGMDPALRFGLALIAGLGGSALMFVFEARVTMGWYRLHSKLLPRQNTALPFLGMAMPGRAESMRHVAQVSSDKTLFAAISLLSAAAEEFFYRGALLLPFAAAGGIPWSYLLLQALWYAANHVAFGVPAIIGKTALGLALGAAALMGGLVPALAGHVLYQYFVYRQFTPKQKRSRRLSASERALT